MQRERQPEPRLDPSDPNSPPPLKADEPILEQMEQWAESAPDQQEFDRRSEWLQKNVYQDPEFMSMATAIRADSTSTSSSP